MSGKKFKMIIHKKVLVGVSNEHVSPDVGRRVTQPGNSGSFVLNSDNEVVGLLFAGSRTRTRVVPIGEVLKTMKLEGVV